MLQVRQTWHHAKEYKGGGAGPRGQGAQIGQVQGGAPRANRFYTLHA